MREEVEMTRDGSQKANETGENIATYRNIYTSFDSILRSENQASGVARKVTLPMQGEGVIGSFR
jgi:hypothetical protein